MAKAANRIEALSPGEKELELGNWICQFLCAFLLFSVRGRLIPNRLDRKQGPVWRNPSLAAGENGRRNGLGCLKYPRARSSTRIAKKVKFPLEKGGSVRMYIYVGQCESAQQTATPVGPGVSGSPQNGHSCGPNCGQEGAAVVGDESH